MTHQSACPSRQGGVSIITAIFLLLLMGALAALMANVISTAHVTSAEDVLGARAYQAARGGVEWGLYQVLDPDNAHANSAAATSAQLALVGCFANGTPVAGLGADVTVDCSSTNWREGSKFLRIYVIRSTAKLPGPNGLIVERQLEVTVEKCRDGAAGVVRPYEC